jgi:5-hydroxyisourate hydrolase-like protein (transthyretin family)
MHRGWILVSILAMALAVRSSHASAPAKFRITGTVVDSVSGSPLPDIEVSIAVNLADSLLQTVTTTADGHFEFDGLMANKYAMTAHGRGYHQQGFEEHQGYFTGIVTGPGMRSEDLQFRLQPDGSISGTVTDDFNDPAPSVHLLLFRTGMLDVSQMVLMQSEAVADDAGHYHFSHLQEGKYYVVAYGEPWYARSTEEGGDRPTLRHRAGGAEQEVEEQAAAQVAQPLGETPGSEFDVAFRTTYYPNATDPEQATAIVVKPGERATVDFHLFAVPAVRLKVRGSSAFAKGPATVSLEEPIFNYFRPAGAQALTETGAQFASLAPGHYLLQFPAAAGSKTEQQQALDLFGDMEAGPGDRGNPFSSLSGILQEDGKAANCARCFVQLTNAVTGEQFGAQGSLGGFHFEGGLAPGRYNVWLLNSDDYEPRAITATGARVVGSQIEVPAGTSVRLTLAVTKGLGTIDGIALQDGKPVSQAAIILLPNDPEHNLLRIRRDQSDSDGTFTLRRVVSGHYTVIAVADGWDLDWKDPSVVKAYSAASEKVYIQPQGGQYQVKVAVQAKRN